MLPTEMVRQSRLQHIAFRLLYVLPRSTRDFALREEWFDLIPPHGITGDAILGKHLLAREFTFASEKHSFARAIGWHPERASTHWLMSMHGFSWISDIVAYNDSAISASQLREYISGWIELSSRHPAIARHPTVMGTRLAHWLSHASFILTGSSDLFKRRFIRSIARQALSLNHALGRLGGRASLAAIRGVLFASQALPRAQFMQPLALDCLMRALNTQIRPDGGHVTRSASVTLDQLECLLSIQLLLARLKTGDVQTIGAGVDALRKACRFLLHGDGRFALFNDTIEEDPARLKYLLGDLFHGRPEGLSENNQFGCLRHGNSLLFMDLGTPNPHSSHSHFGALSFEFSHGRERIITNCGAYRGPSAEWRKVCKSTPAHSALSAGDQNAYPMIAGSALPFLYEPRVDIKMTRNRELTEIDATYNGYQSQFGLLHTRQFRLHNSGTRLDGVDRLSHIESEIVQMQFPIHVRFHLHPAVRVIRAQDKEMHLLLPGSTRPWVFTASANLSIEESIYTGKSGKPQPTSQIVMQAVCSTREDMRLSWVLYMDAEIK